MCRCDDAAILRHNGTKQRPQGAIDTSPLEPSPAADTSRDLSHNRGAERGTGRAIRSRASGVARSTNSPTGVDGQVLRSSQPLCESAVQRGRRLLVQLQHAAIRRVRVQHDDPVLFGHQQIGESRRAVRLTSRYDYPAMTATHTTPAVQRWFRVFLVHAAHVG